MISLPDEYAGAVISEATLRSEDLLRSFYDFIKEHKEETELDEDRWDKLEKEIEPIFSRMISSGFCGSMEFADEDRETTSYLINEDIFDILVEMSPKNTCFGANEGDGACFGFWSTPEEEAECGFPYSGDER